MKRLTFCFLLLCLPVFSFGKRYIFFLHNRFLEISKLTDAHPEYGRAEYVEIITAFKQKGFEVISEKRPSNTDAADYAKKVVRQIDSLIRIGVSPADITVIGTSKGCYIAECVSGFLKNKAVSYVFIGCCNEDVSDNPDVLYYGNILSIYEKSDQWHSCQKMKEKSGTNVTRFKEIELNTGMKHGFLFKALNEWIEPAAKWANHKYD